MKSWELVILKFITISFLLGEPINAQIFSEEWEFIPVTPDALIAESIILDGRPLFRVTAPVGGDNALSLKQRIQEIDRNLQQVIKEGIDPNQLQVKSEIDETSNQPVIYINDQYVMTITSLDAQLQNQTPEQWAGEVERIFRSALLNYYQERQPDALLRQIILLCLLLVVLLLLTYLINRQQHILQNNRSTLEMELSSLNQQQPLTEEEIQEISQEKFLLQRQIFEIRSKQWLLFLCQAAMWLVVTVIALGIMPYSRRIQLLIIGVLQGTVFQLFSIILVTGITSRLGEQVIDRFFLTMSLNPWWQSSQRLKRRLDTFTSITKSLVNIVIATIGIIFALGLLGINVAPIIASLGFIGLGISLAGQDLIKDMINGVLILLEDQFAEGDVIMVDGRAGQVENITLRITQLRNTEGALITIPNREIKTVENLSNGWSRVDMTIDVAYNTDLDRAMAIMEEVGENMSQEWGWQQKIIESPEIQGVDKFGDNSIGLRIWIKVQPLQQWSVAREYRRRLKLAFDREGISLPFPQRSIWFENELSFHRKED